MIQGVRLTTSLTVKGPGLGGGKPRLATPSWVLIGGGGMAMGGATAQEPDLPSWVILKVPPVINLKKYISKVKPCK